MPLGVTLCGRSLSQFRLANLFELMFEVWMDDPEEESPVSNYAELLHDNTSYSQSLALVDWILIFVQFLRFKYGISEAIIGLLLRFFKTLFMILGRFSDICKEISDSLTKIRT